MKCNIFFSRRSWSWSWRNDLVISGFTLYQGKKRKKYKELGPAKFPCYCKRVVLSDLFITRFRCIGISTRLPSSTFGTDTGAMQYELDPIVQWNLVIKRSDITKPSYNKVILLVPALYKLMINLDKTNYMVFRPHNLNIDTSSLNITLNDHKIQNVKFTKFLGVTIEHLSWKYHVNDIAW